MSWALPCVTAARRRKSPQAAGAAYEVLFMPLLRRDRPVPVRAKDTVPDEAASSGDPVVPLYDSLSCRRG